MTEDELSAENTAVALVGQGTPFVILEGDALKPYLAALKADEDVIPPGKFCFTCVASMPVYVIRAEHMPWPSAVEATVLLCCFLHWHRVVSLTHKEVSPS